MRVFLSRFTGDVAGRAVLRLLPFYSELWYVTHQYDYPIRRCSKSPFSPGGRRLEPALSIAKGMRERPPHHPHLNPLPSRERKYSHILLNTLSGPSEGA